MHPAQAIAERSVRMAQTLPTTIVEKLADVLIACKPENLISEITRQFPHHHQRNVAKLFVEQWRVEAPEVDSSMVAMALRTAAASEKLARDSKSAELVWTGPECDQAGLRKTEPAILQVLNNAKSKITVVSYSVFRIPKIGNALVQAARRGVRLTVILETPDLVKGQGEYSTIRALGEEVANCSSVYYWPKENRPLGENNNPGLLHVKCIVADGEWMFLSSANLTQQAFTINMELGVLIRGGTMPAQVEEQFDRLIQTEVLKRV